MLLETCGLYYNRATIVATIVILVSWIILIIRVSIKDFKQNDLAYLDYDRSYGRNTVIVLATGIGCTLYHKIRLKLETYRPRIAM